MIDTTRGETRRSPERILFEFYGRLNRGDVDAAEELLTDSVRCVRRTDGRSGPIVSDGPESVLEDVFLKRDDCPDGIRVQVVPKRVTESGETVLVEGSFVGNSESAFELPFTHDYEIKDGRIVRLITETETDPFREKVSDIPRQPVE